MPKKTTPSRDIRLIRLRVASGTVKESGVPRFVFDDILHWLNSRNSGAARARTILETLKRFSESKDSSAENLNRLNHQLENYLSSPLVIRDARNGKVFVERLVRKRSGSQRSYREAFVVFFILDFVKARKLRLLKKCEECTKWFRATSGRHQRFCKIRCRETYLRSPRSRERKRQYRSMLRETHRRLESPGTSV